MAAGAPVPVDRLLAPFREFARTSASGGLVLIVAALVALAWANSPWGDSYDRLWHTEFAVRLGDAGTRRGTTRKRKSAFVPRAKCAAASAT